MNEIVNERESTRGRERERERERERQREGGEKIDSLQLILMSSDGLLQADIDTYDVTSEHQRQLERLSLSRSGKTTVNEKSSDGNVMSSTASNQTDLDN